jgi:carbon-monoxide dehydrogenase medium subunit
MLHRSGLDELRVENGRSVIGAMVPVAALADCDEELLSLYAGHIADGEVRRNATVGGNICAPPGRELQRGDLGAPLIALGAEVRSTGAGGERTEPVEDFLAGDRAGRLVLDVSYERTPRRSSASGLRRRHAHSYAVASVAACARGDGSELRLAVAGATPTAVRCRTVEQSREPADVLSDVEPLDDAVASAAYRRKILPLLVREALDRLESA